MKVKKYLVEDMQEALRVIKKDLGPDALILSTRKVRKGGSFGLFSKIVLEVTAAVDNIREEKEKPLPETSYSKGAIFQVESMKKNEVEGLKQELVDLKKILGSTSPNPSSTSSTEEFDYLRQDVVDLKNIIYSLIRDTGEGKALNLHKNLYSIYQNLLANEVDQKIAYKLVSLAGLNLSEDVLERSETLKKYMIKMIAKNIKVSGITKPESGNCNLIFFIGPTGVGKTTTLAKLAAQCALKRKKIVLITVDTYRIAAVEQLKTYARITNTPIEVATSPEKFKEAINRHRDKEYIFVDTAGRSQLNKSQMDELTHYMIDYEPCEKHLVLSVTSKSSDLKEITKRFSKLNFDKLLFTKLDETTAFGPILNEAVWCKKPISYLTTGQSVPQDIEVATDEKIAELVMLGSFDSLRKRVET
jgi:flagellar biosynthesis protein FlhF